ncbi:hypothetical protein BLNAU_2210 [Blattamonas nauphoetae]|uniref:Uncharacterized protein n=1 Tax=Blattamonas nauphoetae TaxID=2049346 RepID=A0ABQ9YGC6_9EUKA|nr:hypothetical protein BLNAU_2210 [Blattamonas nauphoetae]
MDHNDTPNRVITPDSPISALHLIDQAGKFAISDLDNSEIKELRPLPLHDKEQIVTSLNYLKTVTTKVLKIARRENPTGHRPFFDVLTDCLKTMDSEIQQHVVLLIHAILLTTDSRSLFLVLDSNIISPIVTILQPELIPMSNLHFHSAFISILSSMSSLPLTVDLTLFDIPSDDEKEWVLNKLAVEVLQPAENYIIYLFSHRLDSDSEKELRLLFSFCRQLVQLAPLTLSLQEVSHITNALPVLLWNISDSLNMWDTYYDLVTIDDVLSSPSEEQRHHMHPLSSVMEEETLPELLEMHRVGYPVTNSRRNIPGFVKRISWRFGNNS